MGGGKTKTGTEPQAMSRLGAGSQKVILTEPYSGSFPNAEQEVAYCRSILAQAALAPGEIAVINASCAEVFDAAPSFVLAAADLGVQVAIVDPQGESVSNQQITEQTAAMERVAAGQGTHIAVLSMDRGAGQPLTEHPDSQKMRNTAPGEDQQSDARWAAIERFHQAFDTWQQGLATGATRWSETRWPTLGWAQAVYPDVYAQQGPQEALRQLTAVIQQATLANSPQQQQAKQQLLARRAAALNDPQTGASQYQQVTITSPPASQHPADIGTDLSITIAPESRFASAYVPEENGRVLGLNHPSEEVYTTPDKELVSGYFTTTRPYVTVDNQGQTVAISGIVGRFDAQGRMELTAFNPEDQQFLDRDFNDQGPAPTNVLSELGLVDSSGPLAASGRVFYDTMYDEGTGVHLGTGTSHAKYTGGQQERIAPIAGPAHRDLVIGQPETTVIGYRPDGSKETLIGRGLWKDLG